MQGGAGALAAGSFVSTRSALWRGFNVACPPSLICALPQKGNLGADSVQLLADEVAAWMGVGGVVTQVGAARRGGLCSA